MKRFLISVIISSMLLLPMTSFAEETAAVTVEDNSIVTTTEQSRELTQAEKNTLSRLKFLQSVGVMTGYGEADIIENKSLTREDFVKIVYSMYNGKIGTAPASYDDISSSDEIYGALGTLTELGIFSGDDNNRFNPQNTLKSVELITTTVIMLGYKPFAENMGGYYEGYIKVASDIGIAKDISTVSDVTINMVTDVMYRVMHADVIEKDYMGNVEKNDKTFMGQWFDIYEGSGYVQANMYSGTIGRSKTSKNSVIIDGVNYLDTDGKAKDYLGYKIDFYYINNDNETKIVYAEPNKNTEVVTINSELLETDDSGFTMFNITYRSGNRTKSLRLSEDVTVIYNGAEYSGFTAEFFKNVDGKFTAVNNTGKSVYDTLIIQSYEYYIVDKANVERNSVSDKFSRTLDCRLDKKPEDVIWQDINGNPTAIDALEEYDVLAVEKSIGNEFFRITVLKNYYEGDITGWGSDRGRSTISFGDKEYIISEHYYDRNDENYPLSEGFFGNAFVVLDINNKVILLESQASSYKLGVLMKVSYDKDEQIMFAKLYGTDAQMATYTVSDKLKVDGVQISKGDDRYNSAISLLQKGDVIRSLTTAEINSGVTLPSDFVFQVVRYSLDEDGKLANIDTANEDKIKSTEELVNLCNIDTATSRGRQFRYKTSGNAFEKIIGTGNAVILYVPSPAEYDNADAYAIKKPDFTNDGNYTFIPYATSYEDNNKPKALVFIDSYKVEASAGKPYMFDKTETVANEDGDVLTQITCWNGKEKEILETEDATLTKDLKKGDLFAVSLDSQGRVILVKELFDLESGILKDVVTGMQISNPTTSSPAGGKRYIYAPVYSKSGTTFKLPSVYEDGTFTLKSPEEIKSTDLLEFHSTSLFTSHGICVYNVYDDTVKVGNENDLRAYKTDGNECSYVVLFTDQGESHYMYVYNFDE